MSRTRKTRETARVVVRRRRETRRNSHRRTRERPPARSRTSFPSITNARAHHRHHRSTRRSDEKKRTSVSPLDRLRRAASTRRLYSPRFPENPSRIRPVRVSRKSTASRLRARERVSGAQRPHSSSSSSPESSMDSSSNAFFALITGSSLGAMIKGPRFVTGGCVDDLDSGFGLGAGTPPRFPWPSPPCARRVPFLLDLALRLGDLRARVHGARAPERVRLASRRLARLLVAGGRPPSPPPSAGTERAASTSFLRPSGAGPSDGVTRSAGRSKLRRRGLSESPCRNSPSFILPCLPPLPLARLLVPASALAPAERGAAADERGVARSVGVALGEAAAVAPGPAVAVVALGEAPPPPKRSRSRSRRSGRPSATFTRRGAPRARTGRSPARAPARVVFELQKVPARAVGVAVAHHAHIRDGARVGGKEAHLVLRALVREVAHERRERGGARQRKHRPRGPGARAPRGSRAATRGRPRPRPRGPRRRRRVRFPDPPAPVPRARPPLPGGARRRVRFPRRARPAHAHAPDGGRSRCSEPGRAAAWPHASQGPAGRAPSHRAGTGTGTRRRGEVTGAAEGVVGGSRSRTGCGPTPVPKLRPWCWLGLDVNMPAGPPAFAPANPPGGPDPPAPGPTEPNAPNACGMRGRAPSDSSAQDCRGTRSAREAKDGGGFEDTRGGREGKVSRRSNAGAGRAAAERRKKRAFRGRMTAGTMARERDARNCVARKIGSSRTRATHHDPVFVCPISSETALPRCPVAGEGCGERSGAERAARRAPDGVRSNANAWCFG